jgi:hypothetical protein
VSKKQKIPVTDVYPNHGHLPLTFRVGKDGIPLWGMLQRDRVHLRAPYFIDESGDAELFNKRRQVIVGKDGCSWFFIVGLAWIPDADRLELDLEELRKRIVADSYLKKVPSVTCKTAKMFHAKDDCPEVRREVFALLAKHPIQFFALVRDKLTTVDWVRQRNASDPTFRYNTNTLYDYVIPSLLHDRLHRDAEYHIHFAKRRASDRTEALVNAVAKARALFQTKWGIEGTSPISIYPRWPWEKGSVCIQAADYLLWALQRMYERGEDRYLDFVWPMVRLVRDLDDHQKTPTGMYYTEENRLSQDLLKSRIRRRI